LDFWKYNFFAHILCFISLLILCLEVEVIKRLIWRLNELARPFKNRKKWPAKMAKKWPTTYIFNSSYNFRAKETTIQQ